MRAPGTPAFAAGAPVWEDYLRTIRPVYNARVDAAAPALEQVPRRGGRRLRARAQRPALADPAARRSTAGRGAPARAHVINRLVPKRVGMLRGRAGRAPRHRALGPLHGSRPPTTASRSACWRGRSTSPAAARPAPRAPGAADRRRARSGRTRRPTATSPTSAAARASRGRSRWPSSPRSAPPAAAATAGARLPRRRRPRAPAARRAPPDRPDAGWRSCRRRTGRATIPAIDDYASQVVYNGLTLTALGWAADGRPRRPGCRAGSDPRRPRPRRGGAAVRVGAVRDDLARPRLDGGQAREPGGRRPRRRSGSARSSAARAAAAGSTSCRRRRAIAGPPRGTFGPALPLRAGRSRGRAAADRRSRARPDRRARRLGRTAGAGCAAACTFRSRRPTRGARVGVPTRRGDRIVYSALTDGRPARGGPRRRRAPSRARARRARPPSGSAARSRRAARSTSGARTSRPRARPAALRFAAAPR